MVDLAYLKRNIFPAESGGDYNALFGYANRQGPFQGTRLTDMTLNEALQFADPAGPYASTVRGQIGRTATPMGAYQIVGTTLRDAMKGLGLTGNERFDEGMQDRIAQWIYQTQGPQAWEGWGGGTNKGGSGMGLLDYQDNEPQTFGQKVRDNWRSGNLMDNLALAFNSMRMNPDQGIAQIVGNRMQQRQEQQAQQQELKAQEGITNRTAQWLLSRGREDLAQALTSGSIDPKTAVSMAYSSESPSAALSAAKVQSVQALPDGGAVYYMKDGSIVVRSVAGEELTGKAAEEYVWNAKQREADLQKGIYAAREEGKGQGAAQSAIAGAEIDTNFINGVVDDILNDPALPSMVGPIQGRLPNVSPAAARFQSKLDQLSGQAFLSARQALKGGGAITDFESQKAEKAMLRMNTAQSEEDFKQALVDFKDAVNSGLNKLRAASGSTTAPQGTASATGTPSQQPSDPLGIRGQ